MLSADNFGKKVKYYRKDCELSQTELGECLGVSRGAISAWEEGLRFPKLPKIFEIADFFCVTVDDLLSDEGLMKV